MQSCFRGRYVLTPPDNAEPHSGADRTISSLFATGAAIISLDAVEHDRLCAWISHVPQMISTALAAALVEEYGEDAPLLKHGGRARAR